MAANYYDSLRPSLQIQPVSYSPPITIISLNFISFTIKQIHGSKLGLLNLVFGTWKVKIIYRGETTRVYGRNILGRND